MGGVSARADAAADSPAVIGSAAPRLGPDEPVGWRGPSFAAGSAPAASAPVARLPLDGVTILELIGHPQGATLAEIQKATGWQAHSIRGFLSTAAKKHGLRIESTKNDGGGRIYRIK